MKELLVQILLLLKKKIKERIVLWKVSLIIQLQLLHSLFLVYTPFSAFTLILLVFLSESKGCGFRLDIGRKAYSELSVSQIP